MRDTDSHEKTRRTDAGVCEGAYEIRKPFHISWVDRLWNNLALLSGVKHWTRLK